LTTKEFLKGQSRNVIFKPMILPRNERTNSVFLSNSTMTLFTPINLLFNQLLLLRKLELQHNCLLCRVVLCLTSRLNYVENVILKSFLYFSLLSSKWLQYIDFINKRRYVFTNTYLLLLAKSSLFTKGGTYWFLVYSIL
jgi:hypothetical protein